MLRRLAFAFLIPALGASAASARSLLIEENYFLPPEETTTYVERSLNRQAPLTVEHPPTERNEDGVRARGSAALAGFCREGGFVRRRDEAGQPTIVREREVCENVAPRQLWPGRVEPRPTWPERPAARRRVLQTKG